MDASRTGLDGLVTDLERQRPVVQGRSEPYARALALLPEVLAGPAGERVARAWAGRTFHAWYDRPLLLLAALRDDALAEGTRHPLHDAFTGLPPHPYAVDAGRLAAALAGDRARVFASLARRAVQTNETARALAWLWPAALAGATGGRRPIALADVGASAGLNLVGDLLPATWTDAAGAPLEVARGVRVVARLGFDVAPLDASDEDDARWLRACIWPGDREREQRLTLALAAFRTSRTGPGAPVLERLAARHVPARLGPLSASAQGALVIAYQSIFRDYLDPAERTAYETGMRAWLAAGRTGAALWVELELAGHPRPEDAWITAHLRGSTGEVRSLVLGRCGPHPTRVDRDPAAEAELRGLLAPYITSPPSTSTQRPSK